MLLLIYIPLLPAIGFSVGRLGCMDKIPTVGLSAVEVNIIEEDLAEHLKCVCVALRSCAPVSSKCL